MLKKLRMRFAFISALAFLLLGLGALSSPLQAKLGEWSWEDLIRITQQRELLLFGETEDQSQRAVLLRGRLFFIRADTSIPRDLLPYVSEINESPAPARLRNPENFRWRLRTPQREALRELQLFLESEGKIGALSDLYTEAFDSSSGTEIEIVPAVKPQWFLTSRAELLVQLPAILLSYGIAQVYPRAPTMEVLERLPIGLLVSLLGVEAGLRISEFWKKRNSQTTEVLEDRAYHLLGVGAGSALLQQGVMCSLLLSYL